MNTTTEITLLTLDPKVKAFADAHADLSASVRALNDAIEDLKRRHLPIIKRQVARAAEARDALKADLEAAPHLFIKPRTVTIRGIVIGFEKSKGKITLTDEAATIKLIKRHFPDKVDLFVRVKESVSKTALADLPATDLKRIGVTIEDAGDKVVIRPTDSDIEKIVARLLADTTDSGIEH